MSGTAVSGETNAPRSFVPSHGNGRLVSWQKGQSGNPDGRNLSRYHEVRRICENHSIEATQELIALLKDDDSRVRFMAIKEIFDRGIGKPRDHSNESGGKIDLSALTADERNAMVELLRKALGL